MVSIPHSGLAPFRLCFLSLMCTLNTSFNPSFGLSAIPTPPPTSSNPNVPFCFNPSFGLTAIPTYHRLHPHLKALIFNPSFALHPIPTLPPLLLASPPFHF